MLFFRLQFFDLHDMFVRWVNLPQCKDKQLDYSQFLQALGRFEDIPEQEKVRAARHGCVRVARVGVSVLMILVGLKVSVDGVCAVGVYNSINGHFFVGC